MGRQVRDDVYNCVLEVSRRDTWHALERLDFLAQPGALFILQSNVMFLTSK